MIGYEKGAEWQLNPSLVATWTGKPSPVRCRPTQRLLQGGSQQRQLHLLLQLTYEMGEQNQALHEMRRIRQRIAGGEPPGDDEARNANT